MLRGDTVKHLLPFLADEYPNTCHANPLALAHIFDSMGDSLIILTLSFGVVFFTLLTIFLLQPVNINAVIIVIAVIKFTFMCIRFY